MSTAGRSVMMPSTPRSSSRCISAASSIVHTCTCTPRRWAARDEAPRRRPATPALAHRHLGGQRPAGREPERAAARPSSSGPALVHSPGPSRPRRRREPAVAERRRRTPGRATSSRRSTSTSGSTARVGLAVDVDPRRRATPPSRSSSRGIGSVPSTRAVATSRHGSSAIRPGRPHVRGRSSSWKATTTPSAVTWTSVSR